MKKSHYLYTKDRLTTGSLMSITTTNNYQKNYFN